ncbi:MAG: hypothetical protein AB1805_14120 [Nitrospirota bacterium]
MLSRIKKDFDEGVRKVRWFASLLSERLRIEIAIFKLLYKAEELKKRRDELLKQIGEEVYAMRGKDKNVYANAGVMSAVKELEQLEPEIQETIDRTAEISRLTS